MWLVDRLRIGPDTVLSFSPPKVGLPIYEAVTSLDDWTVVPFEWISPLDLLCMNKGRGFDVFPDCFGRRNGECVPLLEYAAANGFWDLPDLFINRLSRKAFDLSPGADADANSLALIGCASNHAFSF